MFASGALISALAVELFGGAFELGGAVRAGIGLIAGAAAFVTADNARDRYVTDPSDPEQREVASAGSRRGVGLALLAAVTLDGVSENLALGVSLVAGASLTLLVAIFFSNLPESLVGAVAIRAGPERALRARDANAVCAAAGGGGRVRAGPRRGVERQRSRCRAGLRRRRGLASLADTLMPEAFEHGRPFNAFATAAGFFLSFVLAA